MMDVFYFCLLLIGTCHSVQKITLGYLAVEDVEPQDIGHPVTGGAVSLAIDRIRSEHLLDDYNFTLIVRKTECLADVTVGAMIDLVQNFNVDAFIGPPCSIIPAAVLSTAYKRPLMTWGYSSSADLANSARFPYVVTVLPSSLSLGYAFMNMAARYDWNRVALIYAQNSVGYCQNIISDVETAANDPSSYNTTIVYRAVLNLENNQSYYSRLSTLRSRARIVGVCMPGTQKRVLFGRLANLGMDTAEYLYVILELRSVGFGQIRRASEILSSGLSPFWADALGNNSDGLTEPARRAARRAIVLDADIRRGYDVLTFNREVLARVTESPMFCNWTSCRNQTFDFAGTFARHVHDVFYYYARIMNRTLSVSQNDSLRDMETFKHQYEDTFSGLTGRVQITSGGTRNPIFNVYMLNASTEEPESVARLQVDTATYVTVGCNACVTFTALVDESSIWRNWDGKAPKAIPACGYDGKRCPAEWWATNLVFVLIGAGALLLIIFIILFFIIYIIWERRREVERLNSEWKIPQSALEKPPNKKDRYSLRSLQSSGVVSNSTRMTLDTIESSSGATVYIFKKEFVVAQTHGTNGRFTRTDEEEFRKMRAFDHGNVNRFIGIVFDGPLLLGVWKFCSRGTIAQVIEKGSMQLDGFFVLSLIRDIANGLEYIHGSFLGCHGSLTSDACVVDERWQVKVTDYGLHSLRQREHASRRKQLWMAPELLREENNEVRTPAGDVYSLAIIASEIVTRRPAWGAIDRKKLEELLYLIKKGGPAPIRPEVLPAEGVEIAAGMLHLIRDCWSENPSQRPTISTVRSILRSMSGGKQQNLMDHVFNMMEQYANTLEEEVADRTKELVEEKKKSDVLLFRMLPKQVAEKLKLGHSVEPESFESVTVFFSDVVKFTQLSQKCTPIQIVNLLNDLYTTFDTIIENHSVYKVETIGDGYLCVSGLPHRNGTAHVRDIAELSLDFLDAVAAFRIPHLPAETVQLRIGMNTGPCVAGVVGLAMPRYCLFGDTVNTGSRMESNGRPSHIHMSAESKRLLANAYSGMYKIQSRGDVIIKGKGVMETFWLLGRLENVLRPDPFTWQQQETVHSRMSASPPPEEPGITSLPTARATDGISDVAESDDETLRESVVGMYDHFRGRSDKL